jgi:hypothetical protein
MRHCSKNHVSNEFAISRTRGIGRKSADSGASSDERTCPVPKVMEMEISREAFAKVRRTARRWFASKGMIRRGGEALTL